MEEIAEELDVETLVISIAAGVSLSRLQEYLNTGNLIRVMPNTPAQIGSGVSGWIFIGLIFFSLVFLST